MIDVPGPIASYAEIPPTVKIIVQITPNSEITNALMKTPLLDLIARIPVETFFAVN